MLNLWELTQEARTRALDKASKVTDARAQIIADLLVKDLITKSGGWWLYDEYTFTTTSSTATYPFPHNFMKALLMFDTTNNREIFPENWRVERNDADRSQSGTPAVYAPIYWRDVANQPSSASVVTVVSSSASDTSANGHSLRLRGFNSSNVEIFETLSMNGVTPVASTQSFSTVCVVEKVNTNLISDDTDNRYVSNGVYTVTSNSGGVTLVTLGQDEQRRQYQWFRLYQIPDSSDLFRLHFLRRPLQVSSKYDRLDIPDEYTPAALYWLDWYIKNTLLDQRDAETYQIYLSEVQGVTNFLTSVPNEKFAHDIIDATSQRGVYQPYAGYISRRAP